MSVPVPSLETPSSPAVSHLPDSPSLPDSTASNEIPSGDEDSLPEIIVESRNVSPALKDGNPLSPFTSPQCAFLPGPRCSVQGVDDLESVRSANIHFNPSPIALISF
ncbi:hypothetical protein BT96DRAFT_544037 [Gymnopus androsaceus JB14]|uniref:Uncharacterized protein n=1 Tax=Gymnopus androsaceus JB14 TaxID=1447944 RepID=A0A6A4HY15_9AGAR|nr:hypothetical protein BT96DRAFT_544037 [Gymnopus androsaceus JB14]